VPPHHRNFSKRLVKTPKLYFTFWVEPRPEQRPSLAATAYGRDANLSHQPSPPDA
jgi:hypothetical protein